MNRIAVTTLRAEHLSYEGFSLLLKYKELASNLIYDLTEVEFNEVFQTQREDVLGKYEMMTKLELTFKNNKLSTPHIVAPTPMQKKLNKVQKLIKYIFKL